MNKVVEILMYRDDVTEEEAIDMIEDCVDALESGDFDAIHDYLGLEDDYIFDILF